MATQSVRIGWRPYVSQVVNAVDADAQAFIAAAGITDLTQAYSLRKLKTGATQSIRVRRSSDNAEVNIGFNSNGTLDTTSLLSFVGSGNGFVSTFYDQSGNGYNMVQSTSVRQPQIVSSGSLITSDGRVAMQYDGVDDYMVNFNSNFSGEDKAITTVNVVDVLTAKYSEILSMGYSGSGTGLEFFTNFILGSGTQYYAGKRDNGGNIKTSTFGVVTTGPQLLTSYSSGTTNNNRKNGSLINTFDVNVGSITIDNLSIGALVRNTIGGYSNIKSMEVIIYSTDKSSSISGIEDSINSYYNLWGGIVNSGLVLNLDANKTTSYSGTGTTWTDISGNGNNGTLVNGVGYSSLNGSIITFDGVNDYVSINGLANYLNNKTKFSYETWFKVNNTTSFGTLFSFGNNDNYSNDIIFFISGNQICLQVNNGADGGAVASFTSTGWNSMSVVYDGTQTGNANRLKLYLNGILQTLTFGSYNVPSSTSNTSMVNSGIGAYSTGNWNNFLNGSIGSSRLYTKSLTGAEVLQNFNATKSRFGL